MSDPVVLAVEDDIALLTLNRPQKLNALNYETIDRLMCISTRSRWMPMCAPSF